MAARPQPGLLPYMELFWGHRRAISRIGLYALLASTVIAFLLPVRYESTTRLMPPDSSSSSLGLPGVGLFSAMSGKNSGAGSALNGIAGDLLGMKSSGALFVGLLGSETLQDRLINKFQLQRLYRDSKIEDARADLANHTSITEDRKSGIIMIGVRDHDPKRASAMADAYVAEL